MIRVDVLKEFRQQSLFGPAADEIRRPDPAHEGHATSQQRRTGWPVTSYAARGIPGTP